MNKNVPLAVLAVAGAASVLPLSTAYAADPMPPIAFTTDRDGDSEIHVRAADGSTRQLTNNRAHD